MSLSRTYQDESGHTKTEEIRVGEGIPAHHQSHVDWFLDALDRQFCALVIAILSSWTASFIALWAGVGGFFVGAALGLGLITHTGFPHHFFQAGVGQTVTIIGVLGTAIASGAVAIGAVYTYAVFRNPQGVIISVLAGIVLSSLAVGVIAAIEADLLKLRGYRRPSRDEVRKIAPALQIVGGNMGLSTFPRIAISDSPIPNAWTHTRHVVLTTGLLSDLDEIELHAILAHELHHWHSGDAVANRLVWAAGLPIALMLNLGYLLSGWRPNEPETHRAPHNFFQFVGWFLLWPAWVLGKVVIGPLAASANRRNEYEADAAAKALGYGDALISALRRIVIFETARSGWEECVMATHPPLQLRIEALQQPRDDDVYVQEGPLGHVFAKVRS